MRETWAAAPFSAGVGSRRTFWQALQKQLGVTVLQNSAGGR
jgi:hypothetical protein